MNAFYIFFKLHLRGFNQVLYRNVQIRILLDRFEDLNPFEREGHLHWLASCGFWLCVWQFWHSDLSDLGKWQNLNVEARLRADSDWHGWLGRCSVNFAKSRASNAAGNGDSAMHVRLASGNEFWALYAAAPKSRYDALKCAFLCNIVVISRFTNEAFYRIAGCTEGGIVLSSSVQKRTAEIHVTSWLLIMMPLRPLITFCSGVLYTFTDPAASSSFQLQKINVLLLD